MSSQSQVPASCQTGQLIEVAETGLGVDIEPELRRLHREFRPPWQGPLAVEQRAVVRRDLVRLRERSQVLAEPREEDPLPARGEPAAAPKADSASSPGMNRRTALLGWMVPRRR